jgi:hypothetical protein
LSRSWKPPRGQLCRRSAQPGISPAAVSKNIAGLEQALGSG